MGLLDQVAGQLLGQGDNPMLRIATSLLQGQGGLGGLLQKFNAAGLGKETASWVGTGENLPVDGAQISQALGAGPLAELASRFGMSGDQVSQGLASVLPQVVDKITPNGTTDGADDLVGQGLSLLGGLFDKN